MTTPNPDSYTVYDARKDLWFIDSGMQGVHHQKMREAWTRLHNYLNNIPDEPSRKECDELCVDHINDAERYRFLRQAGCCVGPSLFVYRGGKYLDDYIDAQRGIHDATKEQP